MLSMKGIIGLTWNRILVSLYTHVIFMKLSTGKYKIHVYICFYLFLNYMGLVYGFFRWGFIVIYSIKKYDYYAIIKNCIDYAYIINLPYYMVFPKLLIFLIFIFIIMINLYIHASRGD